MGLISTFKTIRKMNEITEYIDSHNELKQRAIIAIRDAKKCISFLVSHKDDIEKYIIKAEKIVETLEKVL